MAISAQISSLETPQNGQKGLNPYGYRGFGPFLGVWGVPEGNRAEWSFWPQKGSKQASLGYFGYFGRFDMSV